MTSFSTCPNIRLIRDSFPTRTARAITRENTVDTMRSWLEARPAVSCSFRPMYWLMTTAPPEARDVNR